MKQKISKSEPQTGKKAAKPLEHNTFYSLIGVFVLALGLGMTLAVFYLAYKRYQPSAEIPPALLQEQTIITTEASETSAKPKTKQNLRKAAPSELDGVWVAKYEGKTISLILKDQRHTLMMIQDPKGYERRFVTGETAYNSDDGILKLKPDFSAPLPEFKNSRVRVLTSRPHDIITLIDDTNGNLIILPYVKNNGALHQVHPLFPLAGKDLTFITFDKQARD
jgi:hypothetical protein